MTDPEITYEVLTWRPAALGGQPGYWLRLASFDLEAQAVACHTRQTVGGGKARLVRVTRELLLTEVEHG